MKKLFFLLILITSFNSFSQSVSNQSTEHQLETFPIYKGCERSKDAKKCFSKKIKSHFSKKLHSSKFKNLKPGVKRIFIVFRINEEGKIDSVKVRAPHPKIETEAIRVLHLIPNFIPGTLNNKPIAVKYSLPIALRIEKKKPQSRRKTPWQKNKVRKF